MVILVFTAFLGLCQLFLAPQASADFYTHAWEDHSSAPQELRAEILIRSLRTTQNYDALGSTQAPTQLKSASRTLGELNATYGFSPQWSAFGRLSWAYNHLETTTTSTQFGLGDQGVGLSFQATPAFHFQIQVDFPGYGSSATSKSPSLGDGSTDVTFGGFARMPIAERATDTFTLLGGLGYTKRSKGFSSHLPWSALLDYAPRDVGIGAQFGFVGFVSLKNDARGEQSAPSPAAGAKSGGSFLTGAINPSLASVRGGLNYRLQDGLVLAALGEKTVWGQAAPESLSFAFVLSKNFGSSQQPPSRAASPTLSRINPATTGLVQYAFQAKVIRTNDQIQLIRIDKGAQDSVAIGQTFDIFQVKSDGTEVQVIARAQVTSTELDQATLSVKQYYKEVLIEAGFIAKRPVQVEY